MIQEILLKIVVFLIPTQFGLHFWPDFTRINGIKIDYYAPTIYLTDLFILLYLGVNFKKIIKVYSKKNYLKKALLVIFFISVNVYFALNPQNTLLRWSRFFIYFLLYLSFTLEENLWEKIKKPFILSFFLVFLLQLFQIIGQKSFDGLFYYFGERHFTATTPNLAYIYLQGRPIIRVPSFFSHPNSLAGFLILATLIFKEKIKNKVHYLLSSLSLLLTASKSAILSLLYYLSKLPIKLKVLIFLLLVSVSQVFLGNHYTGVNSIDTRLEMVSSYKKIIPNYLIQGVGLGNYPSALAKVLPASMNTTSTLQPIHNTPLLLLSEVGLPFFLLIIYLLFKNLNKKHLQVLILVLLTGMFDHYWLTLPQNQLILLLSLAIFR